MQRFQSVMAATSTHGASQIAVIGQRPTRLVWPPDCATAITGRMRRTGMIAGKSIYVSLFETQY